MITSLARRMAVFLFLLLGWSAHAQLVTWKGTFDETICWSNNPAFHIGDVFHGTFSYQAASRDGVFYAMEYASNWNPQGSNSSLTGTVPIGLPTGQTNYLPSDYAVVPFSMVETNYINYLSVTNGQVTDFCWQNQIGWSDPAVSVNSFLFYTGGPQSPAFVTRGTVQFSGLVPVPEPSTYGLVAGAILLGVAVVRRKKFHFRRSGPSG